MSTGRRFAPSNAWCSTCRRFGCIRRVHPDVAREEAERWLREHFTHPWDLVHVLSYASEAEVFLQALAIVSGQPRSGFPARLVEDGQGLFRARAPGSRSES